MTTNGQTNEVSMITVQDSAAERVKTALNNIMVPSLPVAPHSQVLDVSQKPTENASKKNLLPPVKRKYKRKNINNSDSGSSTVTVKNRFKHSRQILTPSSSSPLLVEQKKQKSALASIADNFSTTVNNQMSMNPTTAIMITQHQQQQQQQILSSIVNHANSSVTSVPIIQSFQSPMKVFATRLPVTVQASHPSLTFPCPFCSSTDTRITPTSHTKCLTCSRQYFQVAKPQEIMSPSINNTGTFYGSLNQQGTSIVQTVSDILRPYGKRSNSNKATGKVKKKKPAETIDLVSSDEDEKRLNEDESRLSSNIPSAATTSSNQVVNESIQNSSMCEQHNVQSRTLPSAISSSLGKTSSSSSVVTSTSTVTAEPAESVALPFEKSNIEFKFHCNKAMFGELYGHALSPSRVANNRIFLSLECVMHRDDQPVTEKYTLSVGQNDVQQLLVYFGRSPSFLAIETAQRFAEVACTRIGRAVLVPGSNDPKKRYILLALKSAFKYEQDAVTEVNHLLAHVTPWAKVKILSLSEAMLVVQQANLDVNQQEFSYGKLAKPKGPIETRFIFPFPPKTGGIPVTTEDEACLEEGVYLNDIIIDFYLKYLFEEVLTEEQREKTYMFNSYFYKRLTLKQGSKFSPEQMHAQVRKWTRNVDIFQKDFIVIPVNENCHWYLVIICYPGKVLDSNLADEKDEEEDEDESADFIKEEKVMVNKETALNPNSVSETVANLVSSTICNGNTENLKISNIKNESQDNLSEVKTTDQSSNEPLQNETDKPIVADTSVLKEKVLAKQAFDCEKLSRPCILIFDSLVGSGHSRVYTNIRHYMTQEWINRKQSLPERVFDKTNMKGCYPKVPRQNNDCDCGVFLLQYVESFFIKPINHYRIPVHLESWFTLEFVANKRKEIKNLISNLAGKYLETKN